MNLLTFVAMILCGYLLGTFSISYIFSLVTKRNLTQSGSKNLGASNATLILGWKYGILVGLCDILKGAIPVIIARLCFPDYMYLPYIVGAAAIIGHIYPFYLKFKGGKGFATYLGVALAIDWRYFVAMGIAIIVLTLVFDYIVIATFTTVVTFPLYIAIVLPCPYAAFIFIPISLLIIYKHLINVKRIIKGEELGIRATFKKKKKKEEIEKVEVIEERGDAV